MINDIYNVVQVIINKNNYGNITPSRFNDLAHAAQLKVLNDLSEDLRRAKNRRDKVGAVESINKIEDALSIFVDYKIIQREANSSFPSGFSDYFVLPKDCINIEDVILNNETSVSRIDTKRTTVVLGNKMINDMFEQFPVYYRAGNNIYISPNHIGIQNGTLSSEVTLSYTRTPKKPNWTYISVNGNAVFNIADSNYQDIELPESMFDRLVVEIALMLGIHLREEQIERYAQQEQADEIQNKTVN